MYDENKDMEKKSILDTTHELLKDPKVLTGLVGLGICVPFALPGVATIVPIVSTIAVKCGYAVIGGITTYVSIDMIKDIINK